MEDSGIDSGDHNGDTTPKPADSESSSAASSRSPSRRRHQVPGGGGRRAPRPRLDGHAGGGGGGGGPSSGGGGGAKPGLIPIQRLSVPGARDSQPLVQWDTDDSEEEIVNFFPMSRKESRVHQELTDTFSIEEMSISGDEDDEDDLHLVPPQTMYKKFGCCPCSTCTVM